MNKMLNKKVRIVMDLQSLQVAIQTNKEHDEFLQLIKTLSQKSEVELIVALNGLFKRETLIIRKLLSNIISPSKIRTWFPTDLPPNSIWHRKVAESIRENALLSLNPDVILIPGGIVINNPAVIFSIGALNVPTLVNSESIISSNLVNELSVTSIESLVADDATTDELVNAILSFTEKQIAGPSFSNDLISSESRPKLAFVSPLPPQKSGIAFYSIDLIPELNKYYQVDVVTDQDVVEDEWVSKNCQILSPAEFTENKHLYERVLYQLGNSPMHAYIIDLIDTIPGTVVLHDFYLGDLNYNIEMHRGRKHWFTQQLYTSHGYPALVDFYNKLGIHQVLAKYPSTMGLFPNARGVVFHSNYARQLVDKYYPKINKDFCFTVPLFRSPAQPIPKNKARETLNLKKTDFIVTSFGHLGRNKLNHCIIKSWLASSVSKEKNSKLIFVGENHTDDYGLDIQSAIAGHDNIIITGWINDEVYQNYLAASDLAIQLRSESRGETSAAVLDCMNYEIATIVNANGAMAELDPKSVMILPYESDSEELITALTVAIEELRNDETSRHSLSKHGSGVIAKQHSLEQCAKGYVDALESVQQVNYSNTDSLLGSITQLEIPEFTEGELVDTALRIADSFPAVTAKRRLFIDVTIAAQHDLRTGIQRVVRAIVIETINKELDEFFIEPVYLSDIGGRWHYRYAREWTSQTFNFSKEWHSDEAVDFDSGDKLLILDFTSSLLAIATDAGIYDRLRLNGVLVKTVVYDLLPIQFPKFFPPNTDFNHTNWANAMLNLDGVVCISQSVAIDMREWAQKDPKFNINDFPISWFHLGADIENSSPTKGLPSNAEKVLYEIDNNITFLMVGTIEPRKGNAQVFAAFQLLWEQGVDINLVFVGKSGWMTDKLIKSITTSRYYNNKLFWLDGVSDEYLEKVYATSSCLIAASEGEGFGLPLIEAAQHKLPIIARDIPVFKEVAGEYAYYFDNDNKADIIASAIKGWLQLYENNSHPKSTNMPWLTWKQSAEQLLKCIDVN